MRISKRGIDVIKSFEGVRYSAYKDPCGIPTIGYGHTKSVKMGDVCDEPLASKWLVEDTAMAEEAVNRLVKTKLSQGQYDAVCSFVFNVGPDYFKESTLLRRLNEGRFKEAGSEFERWIYGGGKVLGGLVRRRKAERLMFEGTK